MRRNALALAATMTLAVWAPREAKAGSPPPFSAAEGFDEWPPATAVDAAYSARNGQPTPMSRAAQAVLADFIEAWVGVDHRLPMNTIAAKVPPPIRTNWQDYAIRGHQSWFQPGDPAIQLFATPSFRDSVLNRFVPRQILAVLKARHAAALPAESPAPATPPPPVPAPPSAGGKPRIDPEALRQTEASLARMNDVIAEGDAIVAGMRAKGSPGAAPASAVNGATRANEYIQRGLAHLKKHEPARAIEDYQRALALDGSKWTALFGMGVAYDQQERHEKSLAMFQEVLRRQPDEALARKGLAEEYFCLEHYAEAATNYKEALTHLPDDAVAWSHYGLSLILLPVKDDDGDTMPPMDDVIEGLHALRKSLDLQPDNLDLQSNLALGLYLAGRTPQALEVCRKMREVDEKRGRACMKEYNRR